MSNKLTTLKKPIAVFFNYAGVRLAQNGAVKLAKKLVFYAIVLNPAQTDYRKNYRFVMTYKQTSILLTVLQLINKLDKSSDKIASMLNKMNVIILKSGHKIGGKLINYAYYLNPHAYDISKNSTAVTSNINSLNHLLPATFKRYRSQLVSVKEWCLQQKLPYFPIKTNQQFYVAQPQVFEPPSSNTHTGFGDASFPDIYLANVKEATVIAGSSVILVDNKRVILYDDLSCTVDERYGIGNDYVKSFKNNIVEIDVNRYQDKTIPEAIHFCKDYDQNYYHWLVENLPRLWIIDQFPELKKVPLIIDSDLIPQQIEALNLLNNNKHPIIELKQSVGCHVNNLYIPSSLSQLITNFYIPMNYAKDTLISPIAVNYLRENILKNLHLPEKSGFRKLFISRKLGTYRHLLNTNAIEKFLIEQGFEIVYAEHLSFANQVTLFSQAKIIVGQEGAGMANLIFAPRDCKILILIDHHPQIDYYEFSMLAQAVNIELLFLPGKSIISMVDLIKDNNFIIDIVQLNKALQAL